MELVKPQAHCLWCRKSDDIDEYGGQMLLSCDCCLARNCHIACDAVRKSAPPLSKEQVDQPWFCGSDCETVRPVCRPSLLLKSMRGDSEPLHGAAPRVPSCAALQLRLYTSVPAGRRRKSHNRGAWRSIGQLSFKL